MFVYLLKLKLFFTCFNSRHVMLSLHVPAKQTILFSKHDRLHRNGFIWHNSIAINMFSKVQSGITLMYQSIMITFFIVV